MRILLPKPGYEMCRNKKLHKRIQEAAPPEYMLRQNIADGGYWGYDGYYWVEINHWLKETYSRKLTFFGGCFYPFLTIVK